MVCNNVHRMLVDGQLFDVDAKHALFCIVNTTSAPLLTRRQVAETLAISVRTVDELIHTGDLPVVRLSGKSVRFRPAAIQLFIEASESRRNPRTVSLKASWNLATPVL